ncbi:unnamed protein product [Closterium sp. NIES-64]|nr:unnamed protein product [Closterium sp. NIES-64]
MDGHGHCQENQQQQQRQDGAVSPESQSPALSFSGLSYEECRSVFFSPNARSSTDPHLPSFWFHPTTHHTAVLASTAASNAPFSRSPFSAATSPPKVAALPNFIPVPNTAALSNDSVATNTATYARAAALSLPMKRAREEMSSLTANQPLLSNASRDELGLPRRVAQRPQSLRELLQLRGERCWQQQALWPAVGSERAWFAHLLLEERRQQQVENGAVQRVLWPRVGSESALPDDVLLGCSSDDPAFIQRSALSAPPPTQPHAALPAPMPSQLAAGPYSALCIDDFKPCIGDSKPCCGDVAPCVEDAPPADARAAVQQLAQSVDSCSQEHGNSYAHDSKSDVHAHGSSNHDIPVQGNSNVPYGRSESLFLDAPVSHLCLAEPASTPLTGESPAPPGGGVALPEWAVEQGGTHEGGVQSHKDHRQLLGGFGTSSPQHSNDTLSHPRAPHMPPPALPHSTPSSILPQPHVIALPTPVKRAVGDVGDALGGDSASWESSFPPGLNSDVPSASSLLGLGETADLKVEDGWRMDMPGVNSVPEHGSTAAGVRTSQLLRVLAGETGGGGGSAGEGSANRLHFMSPARRNVYSQELEAAGIATYQCAPNRAAEFHAVLDAVHPTIAVFDRFTSEEAFSFRVRQRCPACLLVLDTQDLHFLRAGRQQVISEGVSIRDALHHVPDTRSRELLRELASMHRCDLTLVRGVAWPLFPSNCPPTLPPPFLPLPSAPTPCPHSLPPPLCPTLPPASTICPNRHLLNSFQRIFLAELALLARCYAFPPHKLALASFFYDSPETVPGGAVGGGAVGGGADRIAGSTSPCAAPTPSPWEQRQHCVVLGTFRHAPNVDAVSWLASHVWPLIRAQVCPFAPRSAHSRPGPPIRAQVRPFAPRSAHSRPGPPIRAQVRPFAPRSAHLRLGPPMSHSLTLSLCARLPVSSSARSPLTLSPLDHYSCRAVVPPFPFFPPCHLPMAECHVYGSYVTATISSLHDPSSGFIIRGHAPSLHMLASYRVLLAPLRYGAGIKGKVLDSWRHGTPVVTTPIGAEGMGGGGGGEGGEEPGEGDKGMTEGAGEGDGGKQGGGPQQWERGQQWGGLCGAGDAEALAADAVRLYSDPHLWTTCQSAGRTILHQQFGMLSNAPALLAALSAAKKNMRDNRMRDYTGAILWHDSNRATEYFSRWIELKEMGARSPQ